MFYGNLLNVYRHAELMMLKTKCAISDSVYGYNYTVGYIVLHYFVLLHMTVC